MNRIKYILSMLFLGLLSQNCDSPIEPCEKNTDTLFVEIMDSSFVSPFMQAYWASWGYDDDQQLGVYFGSKAMY